MKNGLWHYPHVPKFAPRSEWVCKLAMSAPALCICSAFCQRQVSHNWWLELLILAIWKKVSLLQESNKNSSLHWFKSRKIYIFFKTTFLSFIYKLNEYLLTFICLEDRGMPRNPDLEEQLLLWPVFFIV